MATKLDVLALATAAVKSHMKVDSLTTEEALDELMDLATTFERHSHANPPSVPALKPIVDTSVSETTISCLICGEKRKMLHKHLKKDHGLTQTEYKAKFGIPATMKLVPAAYSAQRSKLAKEMKFGRKKGEKVVAKTADKPAHIVRKKPAKITSAYVAP
jgi:predicted transcriptional regulator